MPGVAFYENMVLSKKINFMDTLTCIVALKQRDKVYIGGDSAGTSSFSLKSTIRKDSKVFIKKDGSENEWLFGFTSSFRMG